MADCTRYVLHINMEEQINSECTKRLNTWLPLDIFNAITEFAKQNSTALGKWDYSTAFRILLMKAQYADMIFDMNKRIDEIENKVNNSQSQKTEQVYNDFYTVKTFGDKRTKLEDNTNE